MRRWPAAQGRSRSDQSTVLRFGVHFQLPSELQHPLGHAAEANSQRTLVANAIENLWVNAATLVLDLEECLVVADEKPDICRTAAGMAMNVG